ncbi:immunoglobulin lambda-1 light chain-like [Girardinichthys multiradiatus]|uniref:immunoglobulin lambda-1 light chain-like n=1 Tax=Girardinichthys multiradiatus TaxID=208333 RepID=UPI001FABA5F3|nr:immunoglobulin lambda-1 light chain-like [Girardinichthys multiradiatus]
MDLFILKSLVFPLCFIGHSVGENVLPAGPVEAYLGENITLKILVAKKQEDIIFWSFKNEKEFLSVATLNPPNLKVNNRYKGRVSIDSANGYLTLTSVKLEDRGNYTVNILRDLLGLTGMIKLNVADVTPPTLTLLPPSSEELQQEKFTLTCLANNGLPSNWRLHWYVNTSSQIKWEEEWNPGMLQEDELYSWSSSMMISVDNWRKIFSVTCRARLGLLAPLTVTLKAQPDSLDTNFNL